MLKSKKEYNDEQFKEIAFKRRSLEKSTFENCQFSHCQFEESKLSNCRFIECEFSNCNLSLAKVHLSTFTDVVFEKCKMIGINWTEGKWPQIKLSSPFKFYECDISHNNFFGLALAELILQNSKAHDVDFRETDLAYANFDETDLAKSLFMHCNLSSADFSQAHSYQIDPAFNKLKKAKFSLPEAVSLLKGLEIEIID